MLNILSKDQRYFQIISQLLLLGYGFLFLQFSQNLESLLVLIMSCLLTQFFFSKIYKLEHIDYKSPLISALSLCILLRTQSLPLYFFAGFISIAGKYLLRWNNNHLFNPTALGLCIMLLLPNSVAWIPAGQWGSGVFLTFLVVSAGSTVVFRSVKSDVTISFILFYIAFIIGRTIYLGEPVRIPLHQLQNGSLLLFAFFMISDPKTIPDSRISRFIFSLIVVALSYYFQFHLYLNNSLIYSLVLVSLSRPLLDTLFPDKSFEWPARITKLQEKLI